MGNLFSKRGRSLAIVPLLDGNVMSSDTLPPSSAPGEILVSPAAAQHGHSPSQGRTIENRQSYSVAGASQFIASPSDTVFTRTEQEASASFDNGGSMTSPTINTRGLQSGDSRGLSLGSRFLESYRDTNQEVIRPRSFGDKEAVQIVSRKLLKMLNDAIASGRQAGNVETIISDKSWIMEPYELLVHNQKRLEQQSFKLEDDTEAKKHFEILLTFLEYHQPGACQKRDEVHSGQCEKVLFKHLWLLYPPGMTVFRKDDDIWRAYKIERSETITEMNRTALRVYGWFLDFDKTGDVLIPHRETFEITPFSSERPIRDLELIPDWFIKPSDSLLKELIDRGTEYWGYRGAASYREYKGGAWCEAPYNSRLAVIVDYSTSSRCAQPDSVASTQCTVCIGSSLGLLSYSKPFEAPKHSNSCINHLTPTSVVFGNNWTHNDNTLLFCPPKIWAFSLRFKTWNLTFHNDLREVKKDEEPLKSELYLDDTKKNSLSGIVSSYFENDDSASDDDSPMRNNRGLNILLVGSTGTGKTFTAECLSRKFAKPLYTMTCGDLGVEASILDQRLQETFSRAANWNAMILLDDVDLYSLNRTGYNHDRCALLPTFLRHLEYSDCLTFISIISQQHADPAFISRIHLSISFPVFDFPAQQKIWIRIIENLHQDSKSDLVDFIRRDLWLLDGEDHKKMNARQIRNCMDVALVLARNDRAGDVVTRDHIETVLALGREFGDFVKQDRVRLPGFP